MKTKRGSGEVKPISKLTLRKITWFFRQQIEFLLISCFAVAKSFIKKASTFSWNFLIYQHVNIFIVVLLLLLLYIFIFIVIFYVEFTKIILFFLFTHQFFIQKFISILHVKWTGMNMGKAGWKLEGSTEHTFWMRPKPFCCN